MSEPERSNILNATNAIRTSLPSGTQHPSPLPIPLVANAAFDAVFDSSGETLVVVNSGGEIQRANARARELLRLRNAAANQTILGEFLELPDNDPGPTIWAELFSAARVQTPGRGAAHRLARPFHASLGAACFRRPASLHSGEGCGPASER